VQCEAAGTSLKAIDCLTLNHLGSDYTGYINTVKQINLSVRFIASKKEITLVRDFFGIASTLTTLGMGLFTTMSWRGRIHRKSPGLLLSLYYRNSVTPVSLCLRSQYMSKNRQPHILTTFHRRDRGRVLFQNPAL
jgi:hypothetical protein